MSVSQTAIEQNFQRLCRRLGGLLAADAPEVLHELPSVWTRDEAGDRCTSPKAALVEVLQFLADAPDERLLTFLLDPRAARSWLLPSEIRAHKFALLVEAREERAGPFNQRVSSLWQSWGPDQLQ